MHLEGTLEDSQHVNEKLLEEGGFVPSQVQLDSWHPPASACMRQVWLAMDGRVCSFYALHIKVTSPLCLWQIQMINEAVDSECLPTKSNIMKGLQWLVKGARGGDKLFMHLAGHGGQIRDSGSDEVGRITSAPTINAAPFSSYRAAIQLV